MAYINGKRILFSARVNISSGDTEAAYNRGHEEGYSEGYTDGRIEGNEQGYSEGYRAGESSGREQGYTDGFSEGRDQGYNEGHDSGYTEGHEAGYTEGEEAQEQAFWDSYQDEGARERYDYAFAGKGWNSDTFKPKYDIKPTQASYAFYGNQMQVVFADLIEDLGIEFSTENVTYATQMFRGSCFTELPKMDLRKLKSLNYMFAEMLYLTTFDEIMLSDTVATTLSNVFFNCPLLEEIRFSGKIKDSISFQMSESLSAESALSIIEALDDTVSKSITFYADTWTALETERPRTDGMSWKQYVEVVKGWSY